MTQTHSPSPKNQKVPDSTSTHGAFQTPGAADEGGSWQFKFVLGVIALGVLALILKTVGLF